MYIRDQYICFLVICTRIRRIHADLVNSDPIRAATNIYPFGVNCTQGGIFICKSWLHHNIMELDLTSDPGRTDPPLSAEVLSDSPQHDLNFSKMWDKLESARLNDAFATGTDLTTFRYWDKEDYYRARLGQTFNVMYKRKKCLARAYLYRTETRRMDGLTLDEIRYDTLHDMDRARFEEMMLYWYRNKPTWLEDIDQNRLVKLYFKVYALTDSTVQTKLSVWGDA